MKPIETASGEPHGLSRRAAARMTAVGLAGLATGGALSAVATRLIRRAPHPWRFFTDAEASLVMEICEQIIPRDDTPGATDAGVIFYLDRQLSGALARHAGSYRAGLEAFRKQCLAQAGSRFEDLAAEKQISFLQLVESGNVPGQDWPRADQTAFFRLLVDHTMQGFYGSPRHGGNRDYVSYKILGIDFPQVIGQNRDGGNAS